MRLKKDLENFLTAIPKLEPVEFIGIVRLLGVKLFQESGEPKDFSDLLEEAIEKFQAIKRKGRREILRLLKNVEKETLEARGRQEAPSEEVSNGAKDSEN